MTIPDITGIELKADAPLEDIVRLIRDHENSNVFGICVQLSAGRWDIEAFFLNRPDDVFSLELMTGHVRVWSGGWGEGAVRSQEKIDLHKRVVDDIRTLLAPYCVLD